MSYDYADTLPTVSWKMTAMNDYEAARDAPDLYRVPQQ